MNLFQPRAVSLPVLLRQIEQLPQPPDPRFIANMSVEERIERGKFIRDELSKLFFPRLSFLRTVIPACF